MLVGISVSCRISYSVVTYLYVSFSGVIIPVWEERAIFLLPFTGNYVSFIWRGFLFLLVLRIGCWLHYFIVALIGPSI